MNDVLISTNTARTSIWSYRRFLWRVIFICIFLSGVCTVNAKEEALQPGDACNAKNKLPSPLLCVESFIVDCRNSNDSRELLFCVSSELQKADAELNRVYQSVLKKLAKPNDEYADYKSAQRSFLEGQRAWLKFKKLDCEVLGYLNLKGSTQSNEIVHCELKHTKNRVVDLGFYLTTLK